MKSREEYQTSIFAKRDALLAKRKKNIFKAVSGSAAAVLLTASLIAVPKITVKLSLGSELTVPQETQSAQSTACESYVTQPVSNYGNYAEETIEAFSENTSVTYAYYLTSEEITRIAASETKKSPGTEEAAVDSAPQLGSVTEPSVNDSISSEPKNEMYAEAEHTYEEIAEKAFACLDEEQQSECIDKSNPEILTAASSDESFYLVTFDTKTEKRYQVKLTQSTLELIEINVNSKKEQLPSSEAVTHIPGYKGV